jgi:diguanylate cyclase (GGDEF)-like protein
MTAVAVRGANARAATGSRSPILPIRDRTAPRSREADAAFWLRHLHAGVVLYLATIALVATYLVLTPAGPDRSVLWAMVGAACITTIVIIALPHRAIAQSPRRLVFFAGWSIFTYLFIAAATVADGGLDSPLYTLVFVALAFAALAYPAWLVGIIGTTAIAATFAIELASAGPFAESLVYGGVIAMMTALAGLVARSRASAQAITEEMTERLLSLATHDGLTACLNHRAFYERVAEELTRARRYPTEISLLIFDVDDFKRINDTCGHLAGDQVLRDVGEVVSCSARTVDAAGRIGGDEFALLLVSSPEADARAVASRIQSATAALEEPVAVSVSVGVGHASVPWDGISPQSLVADADAELYERKQERRRRRSALRTTA